MLVHASPPDCNGPKNPDAHLRIETVGRSIHGFRQVDCLSARGGQRSIAAGPARPRIWQWPIPIRVCARAVGSHGARAQRRASRVKLPPRSKSLTFAIATLTISVLVERNPGSRLEARLALAAEHPDHDAGERRNKNKKVDCHSHGYSPRDRPAVRAP